MNLLYVGAKIRFAKVPFSSDSIASRLETRELGFVMGRSHVIDVAATPLEGVVVMIAVSKYIPVVGAVFIWTRVTPLALSVVFFHAVKTSQVLGKMVLAFETIQPAIFLAVWARKPFGVIPVHVLVPLICV